MHMEQRSQRIAMRGEPAWTTNYGPLVVIYLLTVATCDLRRT